MSIECLLQILDRAHNGPFCTMREWVTKVVPTAVAEKLEKYRKWEIPHIQSKLDKGTDKNRHPLNPKKAERMKAQLTLLYQKEQKLMKEMKQQALMIYLFIVYETGASYLSWDSISGISTRGTSGALAQAITYLPKQKAQFDIFTQWAQDLKGKGY